ncbi:MAG: sigma-70 family RNA polymerase sigma factor [Anaerolineae bacterium]
MRYDVLVRQSQTASTAAERQSAFDALVAQFQAQALRWAVQQLDESPRSNDPSARAASETAQDVVQEAFLTAYEHLDQLREPGAFPGWLRRIVISQCARVTRERSYNQPRLNDDLHGDSDSDPEVMADDRELERELRRALDRLPDHERQVTERFYLDGWSQQEIAEAMGLPITTVKKRLQYAREHLREQMRASVPVQFYLLKTGALWIEPDLLTYLFGQVALRVPISHPSIVIA